LIFPFVYSLTMPVWLGSRENEAVLRDGFWRESSWALSAHPRSLKPATKQLTLSHHSCSKPCSLDGTLDSLGKSAMCDKIADRYFGIRSLQALQYSLYQIACAALKTHRDQLLCPSPRGCRNRDLAKRARPAKTFAAIAADAKPRRRCCNNASLH